MDTNGGYPTAESVPGFGKPRLIAFQLQLARASSCQLVCKGVHFAKVGALQIYDVARGCVGHQRVEGVGCLGMASSRMASPARLGR